MLSARCVDMMLLAGSVDMMYRMLSARCVAGLWIRIRINFASWIRIQYVDPDPDPGGKFFQIKTEKGKEIANNCNFIQFLK